MSRPYKNKPCIECKCDFGGAGRTGMCSSCSHKQTYSILEKSNTYSAIHQWLRYTFGKPDHCDLCNEGRNFQWASRNHQYTRDLQEYFQACRTCHYWFDRLVLKIRTPDNRGINFKRDWHGRFASV